MSYVAATGAAARSRIARFVGLPRTFAAFLGGLAVSKLGDAVYTFALPWIAYELTKSPLVMGTLFAVEILPILLFGALAGTYVDRIDRRRLMLAADAVRAVLVASIPALHLLGVLPLWYLYVAAFALALVSLAFDVSTTAVIPQIAGRDLTRANAAHQLAMQIASMAGPALAGLMIAGLGGYGALWLDALSFAGTFLVLLRLPALDVERCCERVQSVLRGIAEGFRWFRGSRVIQMLALQAATGNFGFGMVTAVLMFYLRDTLGLSAELSGLNYAMLGVSGILGSIAIVPLARRYRKGMLYPAMLSLGFAGLLILAGVRAPWAPGLGFGIVAACDTAWVVLSTSVRQELIPAHLMGRVLSFSRLLSTAAMPVGAVLGGYLMGTVGPVVVFLIAAACKGGEVLIARFSAIGRL
ncbi:MAG TPA: MFS transporter [Chloroflexia bacterium]|nr:MFS transporter [Chloroflexia bacterium]